MSPKERILRLSGDLKYAERTLQTTREELQYLKNLLRKRADIDTEISDIISEPAEEL